MGNTKGLFLKLEKVLHLSDNGVTKTNTTDNDPMVILTDASSHTVPGTTKWNDTVVDFNQLPHRPWYVIALIIILTLCVSLVVMHYMLKIAERVTMYPELMKPTNHVAPSDFVVVQKNHIAPSDVEVPKQKKQIAFNDSVSTKQKKTAAPHKSASTNKNQVAPNDSMVTKD